MSQTTEQRIVEMRFDNKQFESGVSTTMTTLQKLKKGLDFSNIGNSFNVINKASNKVDMSALDKAISGVQSKFSALEVVAITALSNITNSAVNSAKRLIAEFTIEPIKSGLQEYETQINAVQTILANTQKEGTTIKDVNKALDELNLYADKTIYNFTEMTRNIGTFTAAGVDLKTSTNAIQGIANLAAVSGSNSQQASTAMYQLSQALATGTVKLMDWNSVVNAGMGGQLFQDALRETSELLGTGAEAAIKAEGSFRDSLKEGWLTSEVLTETLKKFTTSGAVEYVARYTGLTKEMVQSEWNVAKSMYGEAEAIDKAAASLASKSGKNANEIAETLRFAQTAEDAATKVKTFSQLMDTLKEAVQSGWSQSFRIIIGDFEEAKELFTEISDSFGAVISASADARNQLLSEAFGKQGAKEFIADFVGISKTAVEELQTLGKQAGTTSDIFKEHLNTITKGDETMNTVVSHLVEVANTQQDVVSYISDMTGMEESSIRELQKVGQEAGYTSEKFKYLALGLAEGDEQMVETITHLMEMNDAMNVKPSGRELLIDTFRNALKGLVSVLKPVKEAFREVFPATTADQLYRILEAFHEFSKSLILGEKNSENLRKAFKGVFDVAKLLGDGFISLVKSILPIEKPISSLGNVLLTLSGRIGETLSKFTEQVRKFPEISKAYDTFSNAIKSVSERIKDFIGDGNDFIKIMKEFPIVQKVIDGANKAFDTNLSIFKNASSIFPKVTGLFSGFLEKIKQLGPTATTILNGIGHTVSYLIDTFTSAIKSGGWNGLIGLFNVGVLISFKKELVGLISSINGTVKSTDGVIKNIKEIFEGISDVFGELQNNLKAEQLKKIGVSMLLIAGAVGIISLIDPDKLLGALGSISVLIWELVAVIKAIDAMDSGKKLKITGTSLIAFSAAILIIASAMKKVSDIDSDKLLGALGGISLLLAEMTLVSIALSKYGGKIKTGAVGIVAFSAAIYVLTSSVEKLGNLNVDVLLKGLISVGALLAELGAFMVVAKYGQFKASQAVGILALAASLLILQNSVEKLGNLNVDVLLKGLISVGALLAELGAFSLISGKSEHILSTGASMILMAKALEMLEKPMTTFGNMSMKEIGKGLLSMGAALAEITLAMNFMPKNALSISIGLVAVAEALAIISDVVVKMGGLSWEEIAKGMVSLGGSMAILAVSMNAMKGTLGASAAMLVMATSLAIFAPVLKSLGSMSWENIAKGLIALAGGFAVIGAAALLLGPVAPALIGMSAAVALLGVAVAAAGAGILSLSLGLKALADTGVAGANAFIESIKIIKVGSLNVITESAKALGDAVKALIFMLCDVIVECAPKIVETIFVLIKEVLTALAANAPEIVTQILKLIIGVIDALADNLPILIQSVVNLFMQFFSGIVQALNGINVDVIIEGIIGIGLISGLMIALSALASLAPGAMVGVLAMGVVIAELALVLAAIGALAQIPGLQWLIGEGGQLLQGVGTAIGNFIGGIIGGVMGGIAAQLPEIGSNLSEFMTNLQPFISGSKNIDAGALASVGFLAAIIAALTVAEVINGFASLFGLSLVDVAIELSEFMTELQPFISQSKQLKEESMRACGYLAQMIITLTAAELLAGITKFFGIGGSISEFGKELAKFGPDIAKFAQDVKDVKPEAVQGAASAAEIMANMANKLPGTGGLAQKIFGEKSISEFGKELVKFGPDIKTFGDQVKDVKPEAVEGAAKAAEIMANMATKLPAQGGLVQKLFGEKRLSEFGAELVAFGPDIAKFSQQVAEVSPTSVTGAATATTIMSNLANNLPSSATLWDKIFGGGQVTLSQFGAELVKFGESMSQFSVSVSGVEPEKVSGAVSSFKELVDLATSIQGTSAESLVSFSNQLGMIGVDAVDRFVQAFTDAGPKASKAIDVLCNAVISALKTNGNTIQTTAVLVGNNLCTGLQNGITSKQPTVLSTIKNLATNMINTMKTSLPQTTFNTIGQTVVQGLVNGINSKKPLALSTVKNLCTAIITQFRTSLPQTTFNTIGQTVVQGLVNGINAKKSLALSTVTNLCLAIINKFQTELKSDTFRKFGENIVQWLSDGMRSSRSEIESAASQLCRSIVESVRNNLTQDSFREIGANAALGLKYGIESKIEDIADAAIRAARRAVEEAKEELDEHSPSKVMEKVGEFFSEGFANGIVSAIRSIAMAGTQVADEAIEPVKNVVDEISSIINSGDFNVDPVIRPVVDLSDVQNSANEIGNMMNRTYNIGSLSDRVSEVSSTFVTNKRSKSTDDIVVGTKDGGNTYEFNQYNYSPKALSRSEIYRNTNNQFSAFRRVVNPND